MHTCTNEENKHLLEWIIPLESNVVRILLILLKLSVMAVKPCSFCSNYKCTKYAGWRKEGRSMFSVFSLYLSLSSILSREVTWALNTKHNIGAFIAQQRRTQLILGCPHSASKTQSRSLQRLSLPWIRKLTIFFSVWRNLKQTSNHCKRHHLLR